MKRAFWAGFGLALAIVAGATAGGVALAQAQAAAAVQEARFTLYRDKIIVPVIIDGKTFTGVYDSGAERSVLSTAAATDLALDQSGTSRLQGFAGEARGKTVRDLAIAVGGATHTYPVVPVVDLDELSARFGRRLDLILGVDAFPGMVAEVDWQASVLRWTPRAQFRPPEGVAPIRFVVREGLHRTTIAINGKTGRANIDLGSGDALTVSARFAQRAAIPTTAKGQITGIGGDAIIGLGSAASVAFAGATFTDVPVAHDPGAELVGGAEVNIGLPLLSRFRLYFDYGGERAWLAPAPGEAPFARNTVGVRVGRAGPDRLTILFVADASPAHAAGLRGGEEIVAVDGVRVADWGVERDIVSWTRGAAGTAVRVTLADGRDVPLVHARYY